MKTKYTLSKYLVYTLFLLSLSLSLSLSSLVNKAPVAKPDVVKSEVYCI